MEQAPEDLVQPEVEATEAEAPEVNSIISIDPVKAQSADADYLPQPEISDWELGSASTFLFSPVRTKNSNKEFARMVSKNTDEDRNYVEQLLEEGDEAPLQSYIEQIEEDLNSYKMAGISKAVEEAETSEEVVTVLQRMKEETKPVVNLNTIRSYSVGMIEGVIPERMGYVTKRTLQRIVLASEISKKENELMASSSFVSLIGDFLEYVPATGVISEELTKYKQSLPDVLKALDTKPQDQQLQVLESALEAWDEQQTILFENNNSLMTAAQYQSLRDAILQGGVDLIENGELTQASYNQYIETFANIGLEVGNVFGTVKGISGLISFISRRFFSGMKGSSQDFSPELMARLFDPNAESATTIQKVDMIEEVMPELKDRRVELKEAAAKKDTRKYRKTLEAEKKDLGGLKYKLTNTDVNKEARALSQDGKLKFKEARKQVKDRINESVKQVEARLARVQEYINEFDYSALAESELSRINQGLKEGTIKEDDLLVPTGGTVTKATTRKNSNVIDTEYIEVPLNKIKIEMESGLKGVQEESGMSAEDIATRQLPTPTNDTEIGLPNTIETQKDMNDIVLLDSTAATIGMKLAREVEEQAGTSLSPLHSATSFDGYTDNANSIGIFSFKMTNGGKGGFDDVTEANEAARKGLAGQDWEVVEDGGKWFPVVKVEHYLNPENDVAGLYTDPTRTVGALKGLGYNPLRKLGSEVLKGIWALKGVHRSRVQKLENKFKNAVKGLSYKEGLWLDKALKQGDLEGVEWTRLREFQDATGAQGNKTFDAYRTMRDIYEQTYQIRNRNYYNKLRSKNMKFVNIGDDGDIGRVLDPKNSKDMKTNDGLVYDLQTKMLIKPDPKDGMSYVRLTNGIEDVETGTRLVVRMQPEDIKRLPMNLLNKRKGHIDRFYRDNGWLVSKPNVKKVEGEEVETKSSVTHIVESESDAVRIAEETGGTATRTRENDDLDSIFAENDSIQFSYGSSHTKKRGEVLKGSDGNNASVLNVFETMQKTIATTQGALDFNMLKTLEARLYNEFKDMFKDKERTPILEKASDMLNDEWKGKPGTTGRLQEFYNWHQYINLLKSNERGALFKRIDSALSGVFDPLLKPLGRTTDVGRAIDSLKSTVAQLAVVWNPLYQIPQNLVPALYLATTKGGSGVRAALAMGGLRKAFKKGDYKPISKALNVTEAQAKEMVEELRNNGLIDAVGRSNDFLDLARGELDVGSTSRVKSGYQRVKAETGGKLYQLSQGGQEGAIALMNMLSYMTEFQAAMKAGKKFDAKTKMDLSFKAQKNLQSQNGMDMMWFQDPKSVVSMAAQFYQHMYKFFLDIVAEPQYRVVTGALETVLKRKLSEGKYFGKEAGPYAGTYAQALLTTVLTYTAFGIKGGMGEGIGGWAEDKLRQNFPEEADSIAGNLVLDGAINEAFNETVRALGGEGAVDITATYGPAGFLDMFNDFIVEGFPSFNPLGVGGVVLGGLAESFTSAAILTVAPNIDTWDKISAISKELIEPISGWRNIEKATIGYAFEQMPFASRLSGPAKIEAVEAGMLIFNVQPDLVLDYYDKSDFNKSDSTIYDIFTGKAWAKKVTNTMLQAFARELSDETYIGMVGIDAKMSMTKREELIGKWIEAAKSLSGEDFHTDIEDSFRENALQSGGATYEEYIGGYLKNSTPTTHGAALGVLEQKSNSAEAKEIFGVYREFYEGQDRMNKILRGEDY